MRTLTIELTGKNALQQLQEMELRREIRIVHKIDNRSFALAGEPVSESDFKKWVQEAENSPTVSLDEAKRRWENKKNQIRRDIR